MIALARLTIAMAVGWATVGCSFAPSAAGGKSPLSPFKSALETAALEIVFVRHPYEAVAFNEELWQEIDETPIAAGVRQALAQNGFRVGVIDGPLPATLQAAVAADKSPAGAQEEAIASPGVSQLASAPVVRRRTLYALPGQRAELLASGVYERLPLLVRDGAEVHGEPHDKAQCVLAARATPLGDGRARLELIPEVQFGEPRREVRGEDGVLRFDSARPKTAFDQLAVRVVMSPGQTLVLGTRPDLSGSMGHYFFTEAQAGQLEQKLLLIRFDGSKFDNLLTGGEVAGQ
jgi:hypothetical protein